MLLCTMCISFKSFVCYQMIEHYYISNDSKHLMHPYDGLLSTSGGAYDNRVNDLRHWH